MCASLLTAACHSKAKYTYRDFEYDEDYSGNIATASMITAEKVREISIYTGRPGDEAALPYKILQARTPAWSTLDPHTITEVLSKIRSVAPRPPRAKRQGDPRVVHIVFKDTSTPARLGYARYLIYRVEGLEYGFLKAWDEADAFRFNPSFAAWLQNQRISSE